MEIRNTCISLNGQCCSLAFERVQTHFDYSAYACCMTTAQWNKPMMNKAICHRTPLDAYKIWKHSETDCFPKVHRPLGDFCHDIFDAYN